jgi:lysyl-tRNA synthetase class 2
MPSTVIHSFRYDADTHRLHIVFRSGRCYVYEEVPEEIFQAMKTAFAKGEFFNAHIRDRFRFSRDESQSPKH